MLVLSMFVYIIFYPLIPRFIISIRRMYDRDLCGRWQGIDTGFGVLSRPNACTMSAMVFDDDNLPPYPAVEDDRGRDPFSVEVVGEGMGQV